MTLLHNTTTIMDAMQRAAAMRAYDGFIDMLTQPEPRPHQVYCRYGRHTYVPPSSFMFDIGPHGPFDCVWIVPGTLEREGEDQEFSSIRPLLDWLNYNGYTVVTKATKEFIDATGCRKLKGNMDIELAVHAMELAEHIDHLVLFSGNGDFRSLAEAIQRRAVRVTVVSTIASQPSMVSDELRRQADDFVNIVELQPFISRDPTERPASRDLRHYSPDLARHRESSSN
jgi:uncharacterized LabA/DUF88 family protein